MGQDKKAFQAKLDAHHSGQSNEPISGPAHTLTFEAVCQELNSSADDGLTPEEAKKRLERYGKNELDNGPGVNPVRILVRQIANAMMLVSFTAFPFVLLRCYAEEGNTAIPVHSTTTRYLTQAPLYLGPVLGNGCLVRHRLVH